MSELKGRLRKLRLYALAEEFDDLCAHAAKDRSGPAALIERVADIEEKARTKKSLERRMSQSRIGRLKPMADFDWSWPKRIDRELVEDALRLGFLAQSRNVVLVAPQGLGKTMIAQNIAYQAVLAGNSVLFTTAAQMLLDLGSQESSRALERRLRHYAKVGLLVLDEIGYLAFDNRNADLLFQVVSMRYEKSSLVLTTNLPFAEWSTIFPNAACVTALIDRVVHHADIVAIEGKSHRLRQAEGDAEQRSGDPSNKKKR
jgi:DNA replication protein DnaC